MTRRSDQWLRRVVQAKLWPSSFSMVPRTRTFCAWADTELSANVAANIATTKTCDVILISFLPHSRCARSKLAHPIVLRTVAGHRPRRGTVAVGLAGNESWPAPLDVGRKDSRQQRSLEAMWRRREQKSFV